MVEDDPVAAEAHRLYVERVPGFTVAGVVHSAAEAQRALRPAVDLLLLDQYLPDGNGLELCRNLRAAGHLVDVMMVTSARDLVVVRAAVSTGVVQYLLKPFTFATLRDKLERYARFRRGVDGAAVADQTEVDHLFATLRGTDTALPKGMSGATLDAVVAVLRQSAEGLSAGAAGDLLGMSRVTARRYLEYLADNGLAVRHPQYGQVGRPELRYQWAPAQNGRETRSANL
ncbi:response regulator [Actinophytocola sp.]|uniref:response regulator n=1 Tax=Actinophytocola sp. TaxID=1872138 RepID=UPI0025BF5136|nr:response regulator [Actinophytocola sp.]